MQATTTTTPGTREDAATDLFAIACRIERSLPTLKSLTTNTHLSPINRGILKKVLADLQIVMLRMDYVIGDTEGGEVAE
jgi:hypothetical protein